MLSLIFKILLKLPNEKQIKIDFVLEERVKKSFRKVCELLQEVVPHHEDKGVIEM